ncbi:MAG: CooT family nickel-binding protein [Desulfobulbaceae bacterium]|nr:CooT family nickel-binding protein [Desulfobulbaceae bacterium]HIJ89263.1 CooT family nickel-binding protein [Deltaproteobacteria bacterium]
MCQMRVVLEQDGNEAVVAESASQLEVCEDGIRISTLFEEPQFIRGAAVRAIDFLNGRVTVIRKGEKA